MKRRLTAVASALILLLSACTSRHGAPPAPPPTQHPSSTYTPGIQWEPHVVMTDFCNEHLLDAVALPAYETLTYRDRRNSTTGIAVGLIRCIIEPDPLSSGLSTEVFARGDLQITEFNPELPPSDPRWNPDVPGSTYAIGLDGIPLSKEELFDDDVHVSGEIIAYAHPTRFVVVTGGLQLSLKVMFIVSGATEAEPGGFEDDAAAIFDVYMRTIAEELI